MNPHTITFADLETNPILTLLGATEGDTVVISKPTADKANANSGGAADTTASGDATAANDDASVGEGAGAGTGAADEDPEKQEIDAD